MAFLLDANVFIQSKNLHYGFEFCPAFWAWLDQENAAGNVFSIEKVGDELLAGADDLADWAKQRGAGFFTPPDPGIVTGFTKVSNWAQTQGYDPAAVSTFLQIADYYLVAQAVAKNFTVVTHEVPSPSVKKIKIPNVCIGLSIKCVTPFEMLRVAKARFVLGPSDATLH